MAETSISQLLQEWPEQLRETAKLVIDKYGDHDETTPTQLTWHQAGHWK